MIFKAFLWLVGIVEVTFPFLGYILCGLGVLILIFALIDSLFTDYCNATNF